MGHVLVIAEHSEGKLRKLSYPVVTFAKQAAALTGGQVIGLVLGAGAKAVADELAVLGCDRVVLVDDAALSGQLAETLAPVVAQLVGELGIEVVTAAGSAQGKDHLPRIAGLLDAGMVAEAVAVAKEGEALVFKRPMAAGNVFAKVVVESPIKVVSVQTTAFEPAVAGAAATIEVRPFTTGASALTQFVSFDRVKSERPELTDASVVISGGRGLKSVEGFKMIEELADLFGGAVGASRAACDAGMCPPDWQVGQTGKTVAPKLYVAVAISGAIQHLAGMKGSKTIVAINTNPEAPIFQAADYGLVADAFKVVPELTQKLRALRKE